MSIKSVGFLRMSCGNADWEGTIKRIYVAFSTDCKTMNVENLRHIDLPKGASPKETAKALRQLAKEVRK